MSMSASTAFAFSEVLHRIGSADGSEESADHRSDPKIESASTSSSVPMIIMTMIVVLVTSWHMCMIMK